MKNIVIVDIDGTIANVAYRVKYLEQTPKDWDSFYNACSEDEPIVPICNMIKNLTTVYKIVFVTGRRESCREATSKFIYEHISASVAISSRLLMRKDNDYRHDVKVKPELLEAAGIRLEDVAFVLEDRNSMVAKWRDLGLTCLQVADGDF